MLKIIFKDLTYENIFKAKKIRGSNIRLKTLTLETIPLDRPDLEAAKQVK